MNPISAHGRFRPFLLLIIALSVGVGSEECKVTIVDPICKDGLCKVRDGYCKESADTYEIKQTYLKYFLENNCKAEVGKYQIMRDRKRKWTDAKKDCKDKGLKLAEPKTAEQAKCLMAILPGFHAMSGSGLPPTDYYDKYWIGGKFSKIIPLVPKPQGVDDDKWDWVEGGHIDLNDPMWAFGYPKDSYNAFNWQDAVYLSITKPYGYINHNSESKFYYVCEKN